MKRIIENIKFMQDGTMVFGDLHRKMALWNELIIKHHIW